MNENTTTEQESLSIISENSKAFNGAFNFLSGMSLANWIALITSASLILVVMVKIIIKWHKAAKTTKFVYKKTENNKKLHSILLKKLPVFNPTFYIPFTLWKLGLSLIRSSFYFKYYYQQIFEYSDGGRVSLDFYPKTIDLTKRKKSKTEKSPQSSQRKESKESTIIVLIPGILNDSKDRLIYKASQTLHKKTGLTVMILNKRAFNDLPITGTRPFVFTHMPDYDEVFDYLRNELSYQKIILVGMSLGAFVTQYYLCTKAMLGEDASFIHSAVGISSPFDLMSCSAKLDTNILIQQGLLIDFKLRLRACRKYVKFNEFLEAKGIKFSDLMAMRSVKDIDTFFNAKANDCKDRWEFYSRHTRVEYIGKVEAPCLFVNSESDPLVDFGLVNEITHSVVQQDGKDASRDGDNLLFVTVGNGGHVSYPNGVFCENWAVDCAVEFLKIQLAEN